MSQYNYLTAEKLELLKERCVQPYVETGVWSYEEVEFLLANFDNMLTVARLVKLEHILHALRDQIEKALENDERRLLEQMATALTIIREAVDKTGDKKTALVIFILGRVAREGSMGFNLIGELPSHAKITEIFEQNP